MPAERPAPRVARRRDPAMRELVRSAVGLLVAGVGLGVVIWLGLAHSGHTVRPWLVVGLATTAASVAVVVRVVAARTPPAPRLPRGPRERVRTDRERGGTERLARILDSGLGDVDRFDLRVRPLLAGLADHALRRRHGVDLRSQPERARELLGDSLWQTITTPPRTVPSRRDLAQWVARLEAL